MLSMTSPVAAWELDTRVKAFGSRVWLPDDDFQRALEGSPADDGSLDLRLLFETQANGFAFVADHMLVFQGGDSFEFVDAPQSTLDQTPADDDRRMLDLTWELEDGARHRTYHRFDRLAVSYRNNTIGVTVGRQAVSWGSGLVFQPLDLFAPFAPTTVDRDYKPGEDLVLIDRLNADGSDVQLLGVFRRDENGDRSMSQASFGAKWHAYVGEHEFELIAGRHYRDRVYGASFRAPLGTALFRLDLLATDLDGGGSDVSAVANLDYSFVAAARNWYAFVEYFHNGFGMRGGQVDLTRVSEALRLRLARGEVFNLQRDYTAVGVSVEWHPLVTQTATLITNLQDGSSLVQTEVGFEPSDRAHFDAGVIASLGDAGEEFGGIPLDGVLPPAAEALTTGGGNTAYLRLVYFW